MANRIRLNSLKQVRFVYAIEVNGLLFAQYGSYSVTRLTKKVNCFVNKIYTNTDMKIKSTVC